MFLSSQNSPLNLNKIQNNILIHLIRLSISMVKGHKIGKIKSSDIYLWQMAYPYLYKFPPIITLICDVGKIK